MSRFFAAACCVIVALQVLVGVPLAVCIGFLSCVQLPAVPVQPGPPNYTPAAMDWTPSPPLPDVCTPPPLASLQPIVESRAQYGSPLAGSSLAAGSPDEELHQFTTVLEHVATEAAPQAPAKAPPHAGNPPPKTDVSAPLVESLSAAIEPLYVHAQRLEGDGKYDRADEVRRLAREMREHVYQIGCDYPPAVPLAPTAAAPTVTEASFNPEPPLVPAPVVPPPLVPIEPSPVVEPLNPLSFTD